MELLKELVPGCSKVCLHFLTIYSFPLIFTPICISHAPPSISVLSIVFGRKPKLRNMSPSVV